MSDVYTTTLTSGYILGVTYQADFGEVFIACLLACLLALLVIDIIFQVVYDHRNV